MRGRLFYLATKTHEEYRKASHGSHGSARIELPSAIIVSHEGKLKIRANPCDPWPRLSQTAVCEANSFEFIRVF